AIHPARGRRRTRLASGAAGDRVPWSAAGAGHGRDDPRAGAPRSQGPPLGAVTRGLPLPGIALEVLRTAVCRHRHRFHRKLWPAGVATGVLRTQLRLEARADRALAGWRHPDRDAAGALSRYIAGGASDPAAAAGCAHPGYAPYLRPRHAVAGG